MMVTTPESRHGPDASATRRPVVERATINRRAVSARTFWRTHPRIGLALKAACAAALAWLCVQPFGGLVSDYPYYAPLGAVVAVSSTVAQSLRTCVQAAGAIGLGATVAVAARQMDVSEAAAVAVVVAVGTMLAGWPALGSMASWVPVSSLFVLIVGGGEPGHYVIAYLGLTTLGAAIGVVVNLLAPGLPLTPSGLALRRLRLELAEQLIEVADGLDQDIPPTDEEWARRRRALRPHIDRMRGLVAITADAGRVNWRARRWRNDAKRQHTLATAMEDLAVSTNHVVSLITEREKANREDLPLGASLRQQTAGALRAMAALLKSFDNPNSLDDALAAADAKLDGLRAATRSAWHEDGEDRFTAAAIVTALEHAIVGLSLHARPAARR